MFQDQGCTMDPPTFVAETEANQTSNADPSADAIDHLLGAEAGCLAAHQVMKRP